MRRNATRLRHIAQINPSTPEFDRLPDDTEVTFLPLEAIWPGARLDTTRTRVKSDVIVGYTRFRDGDILVPKITPTFEADRSIIAFGLRRGAGAGTTELHIIRPNAGTEARYVNYLVSSRPFLLGGGAEMIGVAGQKRVPDAWLRDFPVPIIDAQRQRTIADFLDAETARIDALITKKRLLIELLLARRATTTSEAVSGKLGKHRTFIRSSLPWLEERPRHWTDVLLRLVARLGSGHTPSRDHPEWWADGVIPWITTGEVHRLRSDRVEYIDDTREMISEIGLANSAAELHPANTVVLCRTASAGYSGIMRTPMATSQDFATWTCGPLLRPRFLLLCLRTMRQDLLGRLAMGSTHKTIYMPDIRSIRIPLPPVEEQDEIVQEEWRRLACIDQAIVALAQQIDLLRERRQALITAAVTGELDIPELAAGSAS